MVDSTNPRVIADNIKELDKKIKAADVTANPTGEATGTLTKLEVDGSIYSIPQGTSVTANPEGEAIDELEKLGVGNTIYSISTNPDYSTTEYLTGRKWIDDSDVYEKVINSDLTLTTSWQNYVDLTGVDTLISVENIILERDGEQISLVFSDAIVIAYMVRDGYLKFAINISGSAGTEAYVLKSVTIKYIKVTTP